MPARILNGGDKLEKVQFSELQNPVTLTLGWVIWHTVVPGWPKTLSFFVCLFVMLLNVRDCAPDFAMKALEYTNDFDAVG